MNCECKGKHKDKKCGEFEGEMDKEKQLKHLKECKESFQKKIVEIDEAIEKLEA